MRRHPDYYPLLLFTVIAMAIVAAAVWFSTSRDAELEFARGDLGGAVGTTGTSPATGGEPIRDLETITGAIDGHQLVGRRVDVHAPIDRPINDVAFWAGPPDNRLLVVVPHDTQTTVRAGQRATILGTIERVPYAEAMYSWGLTSADRAELMERRIYVRAERVEPNGN